MLRFLLRLVTGFKHVFVLNMFRVKEATCQKCYVSKELCRMRTPCIVHQDIGMQKFSHGSKAITDVAVLVVVSNR